MQPGKVGGLAALADDDEVGIHLEFVHGLDEIAMAKLGETSGTPAASSLAWLRSGWHDPLLRQLCLLLVQRSEFRKQIVRASTSRLPLKSAGALDTSRRPSTCRSSTEAEVRRAIQAV